LVRLPLGESGLLLRLAGLPASPAGICASLMRAGASTSRADAAVLAVRLVS
jgi:hypothetical protein